MKLKPLHHYARNPYHSMIFLLAANALTGIFFWKLPLFSYLIHIILTSVSAPAFDLAGNYLKSKKLLFPKSGLITGLILANITSPSQLHIALLASLAAIASKHIVKLNRRHIFNPAASGALIAGFLGLGVSWWAANPFSFLFIYPALLARRLYMALSFFALWLAFHFASSGELHILNWSLAFFAFAMATDPATIPVPKKAQMAGGFLLAILVTLLSMQFEDTAFLAGLLAVNAFKRLFDSRLK